MIPRQIHRAAPPAPVVEEISTPIIEIVMENKPMAPALPVTGCDTPAFINHPMVMKDGETHINIDARARTRLGQTLTSLHPSRFVHPEFGPFTSIDGFLTFLRSDCSNDSLRWVHGMDAKHESRKVPTRKINNYSDILLEAYFLKFDQSPEIRQMLIDSTLPFDHYFIMKPRSIKDDGQSQMIRPAASQYVVSIIDEVRNLLKEGATPPIPDYSDIRRSTTA